LNRIEQGRVSPAIRTIEDKIGHRSDFYED
jgi:hypothetical protein